MSGSDEYDVPETEEAQERHRIARKLALDVACELDELGLETYAYGMHVQVTLTLSPLRARERAPRILAMLAEGTDDI